MNSVKNFYLNSRHKLLCFFALWALWATSQMLFAAETIVIHGPDALRKALQKVTLDTQLKLAPGEYGHGYYITEVANLTIDALDVDNPPTFTGGNVAIHGSQCKNLTIKHLVLRGQKENGLNLDDGGNHIKEKSTSRSQFDLHQIVLEDISISEIGPRGNHDGIKCSGIHGLTIRKCHLVGWGGQGIDLVGCHQVLIDECSLKGKDGFSPSVGVQIKGGSSNVTVQKCQFKNAGERPINVGGSTGLDYFRPKGAPAEASKIVVKENQIEGSSCGVAFVGVDDALFEGNTITNPTRWIIRILQENNSPGMTACSNVIVRENQFQFLRKDLREEVNIGPGTLPETFRFINNRWIATDNPNRSKPKLPVAEEGGTYGLDK
jgi:hypothetical protein